MTAKLHLVEVLPFLLRSYGLMVAAGLPGAAVAWTLRTVADCLLLPWLARCWNPYLVRAVPAVALMTASWVLAPAVPASVLWALEAAAMIGLLFVLFALTLDLTIRKAARKTTGSALARIPGNGRPSWLN